MNEETHFYIGMGEWLLCGLKFSWDLKRSDVDEEVSCKKCIKILKKHPRI